MKEREIIFEMLENMNKLTLEEKKSLIEALQRSVLADEIILSVDDIYFVCGLINSVKDTYRALEEQYGWENISREYENAFEDLYEISHSYIRFREGFED